MTGSYFCVAVQKQTFVVCDPVKHLQENITEKKKKITHLLWNKLNYMQVTWEICEQRQQKESKAIKIHTDTLSPVSYCIF